MTKSHFRVTQRQSKDIKYGINQEFEIRGLKQLRQDNYSYTSMQKIKLGDEITPNETKKLKEYGNCWAHPTFKTKTKSDPVNNLITLNYNFLRRFKNKYSKLPQEILKGNAIKECFKVAMSNIGT